MATDHKSDRRPRLGASARGPSDPAICAHYADKRGRAELKAAWDRALRRLPEPLAALLDRWRG